MTAQQFSFLPLDISVFFTRANIFLTKFEIDGNSTTLIASLTVNFDQKCDNFDFSTVGYFIISIAF